MFSSSGGRRPLRITPLATERLELTALDAVADAPSLHGMFADPEVHRYDTDARASRSIAETIGRLRGQLSANGDATWAIRLRDRGGASGPAIGTIGVFADQGTTISGVGWTLAASYWRRGITSEAARAVVPYLLAQDGIDGLEAWVDSRNLGSLGVARAAGMTERARLPRVYHDHVAQTVVMARAATPDDPEVFSVVATLRVRDVLETVRVLQSVLRLHLAWAVPDPPVVAHLAVEPWSGSPGLRVERAQESIAATELSFDVGIGVDIVCERVVAAGLVVVEPPADKPWFRREFDFRLPEGHLIRISGPKAP